MLDIIFNFIHSIYAVTDLIGWGGYLVLFLIIFAETGVFAGFFLPGDSLLITAGLFAAGGKLDIVLLNVILILAAVIGDSTGYWFGQRVGKKLFIREKSRIFKPKYIAKANEFYQKHGGKTIVISRFMPIVRTFAPIVAGAGEMKYKRFLSFNVIGGILWVTGLTLAGYFIGASVPNMEKHIGILVITVIFISFLPGIVGYARHKIKSRHI